MKDDSNTACDLCGSHELVYAYKPGTTQRDLSIYVCQQCGLVQSLPRIDHAARREVAISSGANWGNVRYGKGFSTGQAIRLLEKSVGFDNIRHCLDVGSNRGSFIFSLLERAPHMKVMAVEPDHNVVAGYADHPAIDLVVERIEDVELPANKFDVIYCSHTLEHLRSPSDVLKQLHAALKDEGVLLMQVPNLAAINQSDIIEEWFIDKHLYHFTPETLVRLSGRAGFSPIKALTEVDDYNIAVVLQKSSEGKDTVAYNDNAAAIENLKLVQAYRSTLEQNLTRLRQAAENIEGLAKDKNIVIWGGGRIFDSLVANGGLDVGVVKGVVDKYLGQYTDSVHGCRLTSPDNFLALNADAVIVTSRVYYEEIAQQVKMLDADCEVINWRDLLLPGEIHQ